MRLPLLAALLLTTAQPVLAQQSSIDQRVNKLEKEMKAVQRKVFPGGDARYFEPEITPQTQAQPGGIPATSPITDLTARVGALETELQRLTGQVEQQGFKLRQLEEGLNKMKGDAEFRLNRLEATAAPTAPGASLAPATTPSTAAAASAMASTPQTVTGAAKPVAPKPATAPVATAPEKPAVAAATPAPAAAASADPGEDSYLTGYRFWTEKKYAEAEAALKQTVAKYPSHKRASYAQNLLGRTYLDSGKPALAAEAFYTNYQKMPRGERAPDSLYFLGQALVQLKKPKDACRVYDELMDVYGATINPDLKAKVTKGRADAKCTAA